MNDDGLGNPEDRADSDDVGTVTVTVVDDGGTVDVLSAPHGANLRRVLLDAGHSPYTRITARANCGGRGLCATCGVRLVEGGPPPTHWHDRLADRFGYPRLSCQVRLTGDLVVTVPEKLVWGGRE